MLARRDVAEDQDRARLQRPALHRSEARLEVQPQAERSRQRQASAQSYKETGSEHQTKAYVG